MGRELKRVPLDFDWPLSKVWEGYINPFYEQQIKCPHCQNGHSPEYSELKSRWYFHMAGGFKPEDRGSTPYTPDNPFVRAIIERKMKHSHGSGYNYYGQTEEAVTRETIRMCDIWNSSWSHHLNKQDVAALLKADRLWDFTRTMRPGVRKNAAKYSNGWLKKSNGYVPTPQEVNDWSLEGVGHDSQDCWIVVKAELKRLGKPVSCAHCKGNGYTWPSDRVKRQCARWKDKEPPKGDAYQLWETTSEGSPISPPFATPDELADYLVENASGIDVGTTKEQWMKFIMGPGWSITMVMNGGKIMTGVQAASDLI